MVSMKEYGIVGRIVTTSRFWVLKSPPTGVLSVPSFNVLPMPAWSSLDTLVFFYSPKMQIRSTVYLKLAIGVNVSVKVANVCVCPAVDW